METASNSVPLRLVAPFEEYLASSPLIDIEHPLIQEHVAAHPRGNRTDELVADEVFRFVRDDVNHSWDIQDHRVTVGASEVLEHRVGICYAKSHLLAALLRAYRIPSGICYQRLTLGDTPDTGYCIHALNTVYLASLDRWIRIDARGNKRGIDAQFSINSEHLAFNIREEMGERNYWTNYAMPHPLIAETLASNTDCMVMYARGLPTHLNEE